MCVWEVTAYLSVVHPYPTDGCPPCTQLVPNWGTRLARIHPRYLSIRTQPCKAPRPRLSLRHNGRGCSATMVTQRFVPGDPGAGGRPSARSSEESS